MPPVVSLPPPLVVLAPGPLDVVSLVVVTPGPDVVSLVVEEVVVAAPPAPCAIPLLACLTSLTPQPWNQPMAATTPAVKTRRKAKWPRDDPEVTELGMCEDLLTGLTT
jgi:hypothetical protein